MTNTIAIDTQIYKSAESFARNSNVSMQDTWRDYQVSPEVMAMTFDERKDIPNDYAAELQDILAEKYL